MCHDGVMAPTRKRTAVSDPAIAAARDVVLLFRELRQRMRELPAEGLTPGQASVLLRLQRDGASSTTLLAAAEGIRSQSMTATLNTLESRGLIERRADPDDGRRFIVTLTAAGRAEVRSGQELRHRWLAQALQEHLSAEQLAQVAQSIALVTDAIAPSSR